MHAQFSMQNGAKVIACTISTSATDDLERDLCARPSEREEQFMRLRERIEACTGRKYQATECEGTPPGIVLRSIDFRGRVQLETCSRGLHHRVSAWTLKHHLRRTSRPSCAASDRTS
jgi:hypothetical protein